MKAILLFFHLIIKYGLLSSILIIKEKCIPLSCLLNKDLFYLCKLSRIGCKIIMTWNLAFKWLDLYVGRFRMINLAYRLTY